MYAYVQCARYIHFYIFKTNIMLYISCRKVGVRMLKLGIIGCGKVTTMFHLKAIREIDDISVVAVSDIDADRMEEVRRISGAERGYLNYLEMLEDSEIQVIVVCTPPRLHGEMVLNAVEKEKHVLCEKPLARTTRECLEIKRALEEKGVVVLPVHNYLFTPALSPARFLIKQGVIGRINYMRVEFKNNLRIYRPRTDFRLKEAFGIVEDLLPHVLSVSGWIAGEVEQVVNVKAWRKRHGVPDNAHVKFTLEQGIPLEVALSWTKLIPTFRVEVLGEDGSVELDLIRAPQSFKLISGSTKTKVKIEGGLKEYLKLIRLRHPSFRNQYLHFLHIIEKKMKPIITLEDEVNIVRTIEEVISALSNIYS